MSWKMIWVSVMACCCILAWAAGSGAESHKRRVDLTGRQDLKTEEIIAGLTPVRTRGIKTRGLQPGLATIALTVNFAFDSAEIQPQAIPNLQSLGQALQSPQLAPYQIRIEGHTDSVGTAAYNRDLSQRRAESVKQYLTQHFDITPNHLITAGKGEEEPISDNDTDSGRYKNRRAEFVNLGRR
jgi:OOP family OmpA-OmpF porin